MGEEGRFGWDPPPRSGWVAPGVAAEFPGLGVAWVEVEGRPGKSPDSVQRRLHELSDRFYGAHAIRLREQPIPWAYRVFFRQIGLDPDRTRTPVEQLALERMQDGAFKSRGLPGDALTIATMETGVALRALDADRLEGSLCIRESAPGETATERPGELPVGTLVLADEARPLEPLFGAAAGEPGSSRFAIAAVRVGAVPEIAVEEALWLAASTIESA